MNPQMEQLGAVLSSYLAMIEPVLGEQFSVTLICRHKHGPFHILIGDDSELVLIKAISELQRLGIDQVRDGEIVRDDAEPSVGDHMVNLLRETTEGLGGINPIGRAEQLDLCARIDDILDRVEKRSDPQATSVSLTEPMEEVQIGDMDDAPAADGEPERRRGFLERDVDR